MPTVLTKSQLDEMKKYPGVQFLPENDTVWLDHNGIAAAVPTNACGYAIWKWNAGSSSWSLVREGCASGCSAIAPATTSGTMADGMQVRVACT